MAQPIHKILLVVLVLCVGKASLAIDTGNTTECSGSIIKAVKSQPTTYAQRNRRLRWRSAQIASVVALSSVASGIYFYERAPQIPQETTVQTSEPEQPPVAPQISDVNTSPDQTDMPPRDESQNAKNAEAEIPGPIEEEVLTLEERTERELARASKLDSQFNELLGTRSTNRPSPTSDSLDPMPSSSTDLSRNKVPNLLYQEKPVPPSSVGSTKGKRANFSVKVEADGSVSEFHMKTGTGDSALDLSLEAAVKQWRFQPPPQAILLESLEYEF